MPVPKCLLDTNFLPHCLTSSPAPNKSVFLLSSVNHKTECTLNHPNTHPKGNSLSNNVLDAVITNNIYVAEAQGAACYHQAALATKASWAHLGEALHLLEISAVPPPQFLPLQQINLSAKIKVFLFFFLKLSGAITCKETERDTWIQTYKIPQNLLKF